MTINYNFEEIKAKALAKRKARLTEQQANKQKLVEFINNAKDEDFISFNSVEEMFEAARK